VLDIYIKVAQKIAVASLVFRYVIGVEIKRMGQDLPKDDNMNLFMRKSTMFRHEIDKLQGIIFTRAAGTPTTVTVIDHIRNVMNDPDFDPNYNSIIVLEKNIRIAAIPKDEIEIVRQVLNGYAQKGKGRNCAVVVPNERQEIFLKLNLELIRPVELNIRVFYREDEALNWIKGQQSHQHHHDRHRTSRESVKPPTGFFIQS
jgi:hypothetical protein